MRVPAICSLAALIAGCATLHPLACGGASQPKLVAELIFGRNIGARLGVSEAAWRLFLEEEVAPRFPDGFTVVDGQGQWRDAQGRILREPSKVLVVALPDSPEVRVGLAAVAEAYNAVPSGLGRQHPQAGLCFVLMGGPRLDRGARETYAHPRRADEGGGASLRNAPLS